MKLKHSGGIIKCTIIQSLLVEELEKRFVFLTKFSRRTTVVAALFHEFWLNYNEDLETIKSNLVTYATNGGYFSSSNSPPPSPSSSESKKSLSSSQISAKALLNPWINFIKLHSQEKEDDEEGIEEENAFSMDVHRYINCSKTFSSNSLDVLDFWREKSALFPSLIPVAKKFLAIPATSASCERIFSKAGHLISKRRANFKPENIEKILFLHDFVKRNKDI